MGAAAVRALHEKRVAGRRKQAGRAVILGLGYCGTAIARLWAEDRGLEVVGSTRSRAGAVAPGVRAVVLSGGASREATQASTADAGVADLAEAIRGASVVVATAPPGEEGDPFLANPALRAAVLQAAQSGTLLIYLSSVGVYGDQEGRPVNEETPPAPRTARAKRRLAAEDAWRALPGVRRLAIVRLPGIYGPGRGPLAKAREGNARIVKEGHLFSRIHVQDVALLCGALLDCARGPETKGLWEADQPCEVINCCDSDPSPQHEVAEFAYALLGLPVPPAIPFDSAELSAMQRSFYEESRRMTNSKLLRLVGKLRYDSYRSGLPACLAEEPPPDVPASPMLQPLAWARRALASALAPGRRTHIRVALIDNGSLKAEATLSLRRLAAALEGKSRQAAWADKFPLPLRVEAVSARFADRVPAHELGGQAAEVLPGWLQRVAEESQGQEQRVLLLPLLIGASNTVTQTLPQAARAVPSLEVEVAPPLVCLCPALYGPGASGAAEVAQILADQLAAITEGTTNGHSPAGGAGTVDDVVLLCDHGSPIARVAAAREAVREALQMLLGCAVAGCCMERREGPDFDFNGPLLEEALLALPQGTRARVALLFLQEGKHAGPGGDIANIVQGVREKRPDLSVATTKVLAGHAGLIDLLLVRAAKGVPVRLLH